MIIGLDGLPEALLYEDHLGFDCPYLVVGSSFELYHTM